ncbi:MAG TPA: malic enzyme-like NAD(P)-binding protein [Candidatus Omnitrophota bacterium]|nr:malic enzyme-like NAD(P)-binding protein [Candidatus Omnitrophota bacterium]
MAEVEKYSHKIVKKIRFRIPDVPGALGTLALALGIEGVTLGDITKIHLTSNYIVRDIIAFFDDEEQFHKAIAAVKTLKGYKVLAIQDEVLNLHRGGKIEVMPRVKVETLNDLRMIYTPGVAQVCNYIVANPASTRDYTSIGNTVCIATNGSAVLGLGNIGVLAAMPVMEGKSIILNKMAGVSCVPLLLKSEDADEIVNSLACLAETFSVIMIEDISAPLCFEVEQKLQKRVKVPVFHDDQHGTATVILAALIKALRMTGKKKENVEIAINGAGAAGIAAAKLMLGYGFRHIVFCDRAGAIYEGRPKDMNPYKREVARITNKRREKGALKDILKGKDVFIGLSAPGLVSKQMVKTMNRRPIIFALANPVPEIWPKDAEEAGASIALDGRTINNALAFPGIIRGALDSRAKEITTEMKFSAAEEIASLAGKNEVVPNFMNIAVHEKVAKAVASAARKGRTS